jgi:short-subunit dehydrogenase
MSAPWAVVTGASSGLGAVFARQLAARGWNLLLAARREDRLRQLQAELGSVQVEIHVCDLAQPDQLEAFAARLESTSGIELLVNNAGFGTKGIFHETDFAQQANMVQVHVLATMRLTRAVLPAMVAANRGGVICVSSVASFVRGAGNVGYCATKGWMNDFCEGLWLEMQLRRSAVKIQALCPGFTYTEFHDALGVSRDILTPAWWMTADSVVAESLRGLDRGRLFVVPGWRYKLLTSVMAHLPWRWRLALEQRSPMRKRANPKAPA